MTTEVVIASAARTPMGGLLGSLSSLPAHALGAVAIKAALERAALQPDQVEQVLMGCVLSAGQGQAPARQALLGAGLPQSVAATTLNKMCGSGMAALTMAHDSLMAGSAEVIVAGGMESMSNAPYLIPKGRGGYRLGHGTLYDHMMLDGLEDAYDKGRSMGTFGEDCAAHYGFTRQAQDAFAIASVSRAQNAIAKGHFRSEIAAVSIEQRGSINVISEDESPQKISLEKIPQLKPAFKKDGTITAASSSSISDGAAALVLTTARKAEALGLKPLARIVSHSVHAQAPNWFTTAPIEAIKKLLAKNHWDSNSVDLWEINEAFAVVTMAAMQALKLDHARVNVNGGACALGHPIGASGARLVVTLLHALRQAGKRRGVASLCIGGGEATALGLECLD